MEDRLLKLLDTEQLSSAKFADAIGVQRSSVSHILSGRNKPSFDFLQKTLKAFPMLNADWLILGEGNMYEGDINPVSGSLFNQVPVGQEPETSVITGPTGETENDQHDISAPGGDISAGLDIDLEKTYPGEGIGTEEKNNEEKSEAKERAALKNNTEIETTIDSEGKTSKAISRVIVFYTDKTFESYEQGD